tara:strand:+ start:1323 stop:1493 length:171 start_codon:yes stop_codon:yes gene_type:complete
LAGSAGIGGVFIAIIAALARPQNAVATPMELAVGETIILIFVVAIVAGFVACIFRG